MTIFGYLIFGEFSWFNYLGRLAFPIFAYQISEGYVHTKNIKKYFLRLFLFALISQIPFSLFTFKVVGSDTLTLNVFFTLFLGLAAIFLYEKIKYPIVGFIIAGVLCYIGELINVDYGYWGVLVIFVFYLFRNSKLLLSTSFLFLIIIKYSFSFITSDLYYAYFILSGCTYLSIIPIILYNKKQGKKVKYLLYLFYPMHLMIIYLLFSYVFNN